MASIEKYNREIKFRIWVESSKRMDFVTLNELLYEDGYYYSYDGTNLGFPVMQFIGHLDKNGKEIYESDIVKIKGNNAEVLSIGSNFGVELATDSLWNETEIIGNMYEHPHLLDKKEHTITQKRCLDCASGYECSCKDLNYIEDLVVKLEKDSAELQDMNYAPLFYPDNKTQLITFIKEVEESTQQQAYADMKEKLQKEYGDGSNKALVIIENHDGGVSQRPALSDVINSLK